MKSVAAKKGGYDIVSGAIVAALILVGLFLEFKISASAPACHLSATASDTNVWRYFCNRLLLSIAGLAVIYVVGRIDYTRYVKYSPYFFFGMIIPLLLLLYPPAAISVGGARRWLSFWDFVFMPSLFAEICLVLYLASILAKKNHHWRFKDVGIAYFVILIPFLLILAQPDIAGAIIFFTVGLYVLIIAGQPAYRLLCLTAIIFLPMFIFVFTPYRRMRVLSYLDPYPDPGGAGFQIVQSLVSIGSGGLTGVDAAKGASIYNLPNLRDDFIFVFIAEQYGFLGGCCILFLFMALIFRNQMLALKIKNDYGKLLSQGLIFIIACRIIFNIGAVTGLLPLKGVSLPFLSLNGGSFIANSIVLGILFNISRNTDASHRFSKAVDKAVAGPIHRLVALTKTFDSSFVYKLLALMALVLSLIISLVQLYNLMR